MDGKIDDKDKRIIEELLEHADYTTRQIAKKVNLPITTIHNRIRKLKNEKIIRRFTIDVDYDQVDRGFMVYVLISASLTLLKQQKKTQYDIAKELQRFDFIERVDIVSGGTDLVAIVRVKDVKEYDQMLLRKIQTVDGIENTQSLIVIHQS
ncbi:hypothetical protein COV20_00275 [Candidatus Woesearchaeota archaeon CG10_big_fil_rev_8_21_14_0_10_45_16]|nr:MAG: hypothetical protein COV20_00275 [Candidatus Woesearchaeota archaeon CG10_big_fil_rev_8_21_14_0_10_45_16]